MTTQKIETYDQSGNLIDVEEVEVPDDPTPDPVPPDSDPAAVQDTINQLQSDLDALRAYIMEHIPPGNSP